MAERRYLVRADEIAENASGFSHPWNPHSAEIDGEEHEVAAGDFMGFPAPGVAHHLRNPYDEDLVYLVGGESHDLEVADFPKLGKRMIRRGQGVEIYDVSDARGFEPPEDEASEPP